MRDPVVSHLVNVYGIFVFPLDQVSSILLRLSLVSIYVTIAECACDHAVKRVLKLSIYRMQIFLVKYEYL